MSEEHDKRVTWLKNNGWEEKKGFRVDHTMLDEEFEFSYWDDLSDVIFECTYWTDGHEWATEDFFEALELSGYFEEHDE